MSRNEGRSGAPPVEDNPAAAAVATSPTEETTFNWSVPTEFVNLPSKGKHYAESHPLHNERSVEIRYMTAKEEDLLTSRSLIKATCLSSYCF